MAYRAARNSSHRNLPHARAAEFGRRNADLSTNWSRKIQVTAQHKCIVRIWASTGTRRLATHNRYSPTLQRVVDAAQERFALRAKPNPQLTCPYAIM